MCQAKARGQGMVVSNEASAIAVRFAKAAALVGLSRSQWYALAAEGRGPKSFYVGAAHLVTMDALREWVHQQGGK